MRVQLRIGTGFYGICTKGGKKFFGSQKICKKIAKNILSKLLSVIISLNALLIMKFLSF